MPENETRPLLRDLLGKQVTVTNPVNGSSWSGRMIAFHDDPGVVIEQGDGVRICLPQEFTLTGNTTGTEPDLSPDAAIGARVREARDRAEMTQEALGTALGVTQTAVSYWEAGKRGMSGADLISVARALGVPVAALLAEGTGKAGMAPAGRLARVEVKGFRDLGIVRVSETTLAGEPMLHAECDDGSSADFPPSSLHFITWLPERSAQAPAALPAARCICGPDATGEAPDGRWDCPQHGADVPYDAAASDIGEDPF